MVLSPAISLRLGDWDPGDITLVNVFFFNPLLSSKIIL